MLKLPEVTSDSWMQLLGEKELRILGLVAMGWPDELIAYHLRLNVHGVAKTVTWMRRNLGLLPRSRNGLCRRERLTFFYVAHVLPHDTLGRSADLREAAYTEPGQKLHDWVDSARRHRAALSRWRLLTPAKVELAMLLMCPGHVDKTDQELVELLSKPLHWRTAGMYLDELTRHLATGKVTPTRSKLVTVVNLAPFDSV